MKFYVPEKNRFNGVHYQKKKLAIQIESGRKSGHSKPSKEQIADLGFRTVEFDVTLPEVFRRKRTPKEGADGYGQVGEKTLAKMIGKDDAKTLFDLLERRSDECGDLAYSMGYKVYSHEGEREMFAEDFFKYYKVRDLLWTKGYRGAFWEYLGRDSGLNMKIYIPF